MEITQDQDTLLFSIDISSDQNFRNHLNLPRFIEIINIPFEFEADMLVEMLTEQKTLPKIFEAINSIKKPMHTIIADYEDFIQVLEAVTNLGIPKDISIAYTLLLMNKFCDLEVDIPLSKTTQHNGRLLYNFISAEKAIEITKKMINSPVQSQVKIDTKTHMCSMYIFALLLKYIATDSAIFVFKHFSPILETQISEIEKIPNHYLRSMGNISEEKSIIFLNILSKNKKPYNKTTKFDIFVLVKIVEIIANETIKTATVSEYAEITEFSKIFFTDEFGESALDTGKNNLENENSYQDYPLFSKVSLNVYEALSVISEETDIPIDIRLAIDGIEYENY